MRTFHLLPNAALLPFIDRFWGWESAPDEVVALPTLLPGTGAELYFHYRMPFRRLTEPGVPIVCAATHLFCLRRQPVSLCPSGDLGFIAVRFRAGMLHRFTDIPGRELADRVLSIDDLWAGTGKALARRVAETGTMPERLRLIQAFLLQCLRLEAVDDLVEHAVAALYRESSSLSIGQLATRMGIGRRQMERRILAVSGQSPAEIRRLGRFQKAVRTLLLLPNTPPLDTALAEGYYDQSHFHRDFRQLVGVPPGRFLLAARAKTHFYNTSRCSSKKMTAPVYHL
ncbi:MAG: AraC family transcriptional regulator [Proteobacteria bacterium]|nr:AraC family transcriptional regulator [Pseudomonadota bacterium]